jgi:hypothetical protein
VAGDSLEVRARFTWDARPRRVGVALRLLPSETSGPCDASYAPADRLLGVGGVTVPADALPPTEGTAEMVVYLDRSVVEVYAYGAALTARCFRNTTDDARAATGLAVFVEGEAVATVEVWRMGSMWKADYVA